MHRSLSLCFLMTLFTASATLGWQTTTPNSPSASSENDGHFVVHEWGTFTTFSGSDGVYLDFRPLDPSHNDLPSYVKDRGSYAANSRLIITKGSLRGRVRMETPVTYFYTDRHRVVDVQVDFPEGLLTEFYPPVRELLPKIDEQNIFGLGEKIGKSSLSWGKIDLIPTSELVPRLQDKKMLGSMTASIVHGLLPHAANEQHYAAARNTDSALVRFQEKEGAPSYFEKFLFYRGVGKFQLPLTSTFDGEVASLRNSGPHPIRSAILIEVEGDSIQAMKIDQIEPGHALPFHTLKSLSKDELASMVCDCLVKEGLYEKEAQAMVETWQGSWFTENGTRILYMVPSEITDKLLPLHISPKPQDTVRVLVARMELMSPAQERRMMELVSESKVARLEHYHQQNKSGRPLPYEVPDNIRAFGRMTEPALARVAGLAKDKSIRMEAEALIATLLAQPNAKKNAAP